MPGKLLQPIDVAECGVVCFFQDVLNELIASRPVKRAYTMRSEIGEHPLYEMEVDGQRLAFFHPGVGAPLAAGLLEEAIALGCRKFIACGGAGVLDSGSLDTVESSMAKCHVAETLMKVADRCVQVMGGTGVTDRTVVEQIFREIPASRIYDGPTEVHKWSIDKKIKRD